MLLATSGCAHEARVKVYISQPPAGLMRAQGQTVPYSESRGYLCVSPEDAEVLITEMAGDQEAP